MVRRSKRWRGVRDDKEQLELVEFQPGTIYKHYYTLDDSDPGMMMETNIATKEVSLVVPKFDPYILYIVTSEIRKKYELIIKMFKLSHLST